MRIAILSDIHGNLIAFEAALAHVATMGVDCVLLAGDIVVGSPDSRACWELATSLGVPIVRGNHERYVAGYGTPDSPPEWSDERFAPVGWAVRQLSDDQRREIAALPMTLRLAEAPDLLIVHASPRSDADSVHAHTPPEKLAAMFAGADERFIVRAHNHVGAVRLWGERAIVTAGSVGLALDGHPTAQYVIADQSPGGWTFAHQSVPYDVEAAVQRFSATGYLAETGPMGRLFQREVLTAAQQIVPFMRLYSQWTASGPIPLADAVDRFLS